MPQQSRLRPARALRSHARPAPHPPLPHQREIAADNDLEPATVTNALAVMERLGYVRRESAAGDRRAIKVGITAKGRRAFDRAQAEFAAVEEICFRGFSEKEKSQAMDYLARIYGNLKERGEGEHV
jgi:DNA-binding MarR family transcriptional regulator